MPAWIIITVTFACYAAFAAVLYVIQRKWQPISVLLLGFAYIADFALTQQKLGRPSVRIYVICAVFAFAMLQLIEDPRARARIKRAGPLLAFAAVLYMWIILTSFAKSFSGASISTWAIDFLADYVTPQLYLVSAVVLLRSQANIVFIAWVCGAAASISAICAVLQFLNFEGALRIH